MASRPAERGRARREQIIDLDGGRGRLVSEVVGRTTSPYTRPTVYRPTRDLTRPNYTFWSKLRRGLEPGYEIGGLFAKRICEVDAEWTLGRGFTVETDNADLDELVNAFVQDNLDTLMTWRKDSSALGDSYLIVNADGSLSLSSPDTVEVLSNGLTGEVIGYKITTIPVEGTTVIDEYRLDGRTVTFRRGSETNSFTFANLIGMLPVIHLANDKEANEVYGHPIYEALLTLFARYDDVLQKTADGVELMGRPIPVAEGLEDPEQAKRDNATGTEKVYSRDGVNETVPVVDFEDLTMLWLGTGATFKFAAPGAFAADSMAVLKKFFYLMLEHTGIPEWAWGGAVASSKASVDAQMPAFIRYLEGRRTATQQAVLKLVQVWLAYQRLVTLLAQTAKLLIVWPELQTKDEALLVNKANAAYDRGVLTDETYLRTLDMVEDPAAEVEAATAENRSAEQREQADIDAELARLRTGVDEQDQAE